MAVLAYPRCWSMMFNRGSSSGLVMGGWLAEPPANPAATIGPESAPFYDA
jgi:hypothetical protein